MFKILLMFKITKVWLFVGIILVTLVAVCYIFKSKLKGKEKVNDSLGFEQSTTTFTFHSFSSKNAFLKN